VSRAARKRALVAELGLPAALEEAVLIELAIEQAVDDPKAAAKRLSQLERRRAVVKRESSVHDWSGVTWPR
jgi:hypothetical protein